MAKKPVKSAATATAKPSPTPGRAAPSAPAVEQTRRRYGRRVAAGDVSVDPATKVKDAAPNFGRPFLPQILTFSGMQSTISHTYRNPDEAIRHSLENARFMRNDCSIMECLEARQRATALLNYSLEPEDRKDKRQLDLVTNLTAILEEIERFTEYRRNLLEAIWYGRTGIANQYEWRVVRGVPRICLRKWKPVNGDKLAFRFDDGSGKYDPDQIGIRVGGAFSQHDKLAGDRIIETTEFGQCYFLEPWERSRLTVHKHMIEDGAFEDPISAGRVHGVGVRDRIYWCWYQKQQTMAHLMEVIERTGSGFTIYYYQYGNDESYKKMKSIAENQTASNVILMPRMAGDESMDAHGIERIEPSTAGIDALKSIIHEFFGWQIKRYILGQTLSSESSATGLGSGVADLHQDTFMQIITYDAVNLEETITTEIINPLKNFNFPWARDIRVKFKINTEKNESEKKLAAYRQAWEMGCRLKTTDVMDTIGLSMPDDDDEVLQNPAMQQQMQPQPGMGGAVSGTPGAEGEEQQLDENGQPIEEGSTEDLFGPIAGLLGDEGGDGGGNDPSSPPPGGPSGKGKQQYAKQVKSSPGQANLIDHETSRVNASKWEEALHPRDHGKFAESPSAGPVPSSPGQKPLPLAGDAREDVGKISEPDTFALSRKPKPAKGLDIPTRRTTQRDLFAGRNDAKGQTSFFDDIDPAAVNVPSVPTYSPAMVHAMEKAHHQLYGAGLAQKPG